MPEEVLRVKTRSPAADAHPAGTAAAQLASESVAVGAAYGEKDPVTVAPLMVMLFMAAAPTTTNGPGGCQVVGVPAGANQCSLNLEGADGPTFVMDRVLI